MTAPEPTPSTAGGVRVARRRTAALLVGFVLIVVGVPAAAQVGGFSDVTAGNVHGANIERLVDAGVTAGCDGSRYCPGDPVTRAAMASFLGRSGAHVIGDRSVTTLAVGDGQVDGVAVTVTVTGPGHAPGTQRVALQGTVTVLHDGELDACPCEVEAFLYRARDAAQGPSSWAVLSGMAAASSGTGSVSLPVAWATEIDAERREEYRLAVFVDGVATGGLTAEGSLTAVTGPFGGVR